jgi:hypothetical protein
MRNTIMLLIVLAATVVQLAPAAAITADNRERLEEHFAELGEVAFESYAPLGGPEVGCAVVSSGSGASHTLVVAVIEKGKITELLAKPVADLDGKPYTLLNSGRHVMLYITRPWMSPDGDPRRLGTLQIYELLTTGGPRLLYELPDVCDLHFMPEGSRADEHLLWQEAPHFINGFGMLPRKNNYAVLAYDPAENEYTLRHHMLLLPDEANDQGAAYNNRAVAVQRSHQLRAASYLLSEANNIAQYYQGTIMHNQALVRSEMNDFETQLERFSGRPSSEALMYYWQGDYAGVLRLLDARQSSGFSELDQVLLGLSLAGEKRWREADMVTARIVERMPHYTGDYIWELVRTAQLQNFPDIALRLLEELYAVDPEHPGYITGITRLMRRQGEREAALELLDDYVLDPLNRDRMLRDPRRELYGMYLQEGNVAGCDRLEAQVLSQPLEDLLAYVDLVDYIDFNKALIEIELDRSDRITAPEKPLEHLGFSEK